jgi:hypothetical protein
VHFGEADGLDANTVEDLLVGEGLQQFAWDLGGVGGPSVFVDDDYGAEKNGDGCCDDEGEEGLSRRE